MGLRRNISAAVFIIISTSISAQTEEQEEFIRLYKENYLEWISSPGIKRLQDRDPELRQLIESVPISETLAFKRALAETRETRAKNIGNAELLGESAMDFSLDIIKRLLAKENTDVMINLYWDVIKSAETQEIIDMILPHVERARLEFERMGLEVAESARNLD